VQIDIALLAVGRFLLGGLFVAGGVRHVLVFPGVAALIAARRVPMPGLVLAAGTAFQLVAGLLLMFGLLVAPAALGLVVFTLLASMMMLNFWDLQGAARDGARNTWELNLAIVGGLLVAAATAAR
jgi:putative oxidoreductase